VYGQLSSDRDEIGNKNSEEEEAEWYDAVEGWSLLEVDIMNEIDDFMLEMEYFQQAEQNGDDHQKQAEHNR
jgi:hypothetical protein